MGSRRAGIGVIGEGNDSEGSELLIELAAEDDPRPIWVTSWGGSNTLAQAIWRVSQTATPEELRAFVRKFRIYTITDQDMQYSMRMDRSYSSHKSESQSKKMTYTKFRKMKSGGWGMVYNIMMVFSVGDNMPSFYKVFRGSIKDVKSFLMTVREAGYTNVIIIADKGFLSEDNLKELDDLEMCYILPLGRNSSKIDYSLTRDSSLGEGGVAFTYSGRTIFGYRRELDAEHYLDLFLDTNMREEEARGYRERIQEKEEKEEEKRSSPSDSTETKNLYSQSRPEFRAEPERPRCPQLGQVRFPHPGQR